MCELLGNTKYIKSIYVLGRPEKFTQILVVFIQKPLLRAFFLINYRVMLTAGNLQSLSVAIQRFVFNFVFFFACYVIVITFILTSTRRNNMAF